ncbi:hypothetical protein HXX76_009228 [Chlamydomonas incerta]|uniref:Uncharacterized protein n=1 Tax=Chlamydomonas incerta TaxID=51695 RepID=A0A835SUF9_CHLIN|nr:hypothetical protein HXX76_009228 [Chlamydomonas incerta]|eukprot:KAG2431732.1 hypothetical protein HXX76_009228 [Chlamydomonas incerta]
MGGAARETAPRVMLRHLSGVPELVLAPALPVQTAERLAGWRHGWAAGQAAWALDGAGCSRWDREAQATCTLSAFALTGHGFARDLDRRGSGGVQGGGTAASGVYGGGLCLRAGPTAGGHSGAAISGGNGQGAVYIADMPHRADRKVPALQLPPGPQMEHVAELQDVMRAALIRTLGSNGAMGFFDFFMMLPPPGCPRAPAPGASNSWRAWIVHPRLHGMSAVCDVCCLRRAIALPETAAKQQQQAPPPPPPQTYLRAWLVRALGCTTTVGFSMLPHGGPGPGPEPGASSRPPRGPTHVGPGFKLFQDDYAAAADAADASLRRWSSSGDVGAAAVQDRVLEATVLEATVLEATMATDVGCLPDIERQEQLTLS